VVILNLLWKIALSPGYALPKRIKWLGNIHNYISFWNFDVVEVIKIRLDNKKFLLGILKDVGEATTVQESRIGEPQTIFFQKPFIMILQLAKSRAVPLV
jgi:hypothetical protein